MGDQLSMEQLKALFDSGKMGPEEISALTPQERKVYESFSGSKVGAMIDQKFPEVQHAEVPRTPLLPPGIAKMIGSMVPGSDEVKSIIKMLGIGTGLHYGAKAIGVPPSVADLAVLGMSFNKYASGAAKGAAAMGEGEALSEADQIRKELSQKGIGAEAIENAIRKMKGQPVNGSNMVRQSAAGADTADVTDRVLNGGVQNDFKGPVSLRQPQRSYDEINLRDAYPRNVTTQSNSDDLLELLTGSSHRRGEGPTPMRFEDNDLRRTLDKVNRLRRRNP